ncbi:MAG: tetratricopeptide repeat protein [bacterium]|nr:tetratricopeptide repeat protein [bacterium]
MSEAAEMAMPSPVRGRAGRSWLAVAATLILLGSAGCASVPSPKWTVGDGRAERRAPALREIRAERSADYDVLVGELAKADRDLEGAREAYLRAAEKDPNSAFIADRLARLHWQLDDVDLAVDQAERAFELAPDQVEVRLFLGRLYSLEQNYEGLDRVLRDRDGRPLDADSASQLYQVSLERGDLDEAENLARQLSEMEPDQLRGPLGLATVYEQRRDFDAATAVVRRTLENFPDNFLLYMRLVQIERQRGDRAGEIAVYREVLRSHANHYGVLQRMGQAQLEENDIDGAIATYSLIVENYPEDVRTLRRLAQIEFSAGRYESAAGRLEVVLEKSPDQPDLAFALGQIKRALGDDERAFAIFETIAPTAANYVDARLQMAAIHEQAGRKAESLAEVDRLRALRPNRQLDFHAAALRIEIGDFEGGVALLEGLLDGSDDDRDVLYQLGVQYGIAGDADRSVEYMQQVLELDPDDANALNYIGYTWADEGENLEEAERMIARALELSPDDGYITDSLGWVYYRRAEERFAAKDEDEALRLLERAETALMRAAELTGGDSVVSEHLGDVLLLRGDKRGALGYYEEAVTLDVREDEQPNLYDKLESLRRDLGASSPAQ